MKAIARITKAGFIVAASSLASAQGAGPAPQVQASFLTSGASVALGQKIPIQTFKLEDDVISMVLMTWSPATSSAGRHLVEHRWLHDGTVISDKKRVISFDTTPMNLWSRRPAAAFGTGHFEVQTLIDGNTVDDEQFDISR